MYVEINDHLLENLNQWAVQHNFSLQESLETAVQYFLYKNEIENTKEKTPLKPRIAGLGQGSIKTTEDFDQPLPDSFWLGEQ